MLKQRTVEQTEVYGLALNSIWANAEQSSLVALASSEDALRKFYEGELLPEQEVVNGMRYAFREGPLRNCNPLWGAWHHRDQCSWGTQGWWSQWVEDIDAIRSDVRRVDF